MVHRHGLFQTVYRVALDHALSLPLSSQLRPVSPSDRVGNFREWMLENLGNGTIQQSVVEAAGERVLLSFMRLGFFDQHSSDYPFSNASIPWSLLDSEQHRQLSREAAAKSTVLLANDGILPLSQENYANIAVVG